MAVLDDLTAAFESYRDDVKTKVAALGQKIDDLQKQIDDGDIAPNVQPLLDEIKAAKDELERVAAQPAPSVPDSEPSTGTPSGS